MPVRKVYGQHMVDGINYRSADFVEYHKEFKENKYVKSFTLPQVGDGQKRGKFGSLKATVNDIVFDSVMEARYYVYLLTQVAAKRIKEFERQVTFELIPKLVDKVTGKKMQATKYIADFVITDNKGNKTVVDVKGKETEVFRIKEKLFRYRYPDVNFLCIQWDKSEKSWRLLEEIKKDKRKKKLNKTLDKKKKKTK